MSSRPFLYSLGTFYLPFIPSGSSDRWNASLKAILTWLISCGDHFSVFSTIPVQAHRFSTSLHASQLNRQVKLIPESHPYVDHFPWIWEPGFESWPLPSALNLFSGFHPSFSSRSIIWYTWGNLRNVIIWLPGCHTVPVSPGWQILTYLRVNDQCDGGECQGYTQHCKCSQLYMMFMIIFNSSFKLLTTFFMTTEISHLRGRSLYISYIWVDKHWLPPRSLPAVFNTFRQGFSALCMARESLYYQTLIQESIASQKTIVT